MLSVLILTGAFCFGAIISSFLKASADRFQQSRSVLKGRSYCFYCSHQLSWLDLFPIFSFLFLRGRCRYCQHKISWQHPFIELLTGTILFLIWLFVGEPILAVFYSFIVLILIFISLLDFQYKIIPDKIVYPGIIIAFLFNLLYSLFLESSFFSMQSRFSLGLLGAEIGFFFLAFLYFLTKGKGMGFGDVKLAILMGLILGWPNILLGLFLGFLFGAIIGVGLIIFRRKKMKSEIPFGPFLTGGMLVALLWGEEIINYYLSLL